MTGAARLRFLAAGSAASGLKFQLFGRCDDVAGAVYSKDTEDGESGNAVFVAHRLDF